MLGGYAAGVVFLWVVPAVAAVVGAALVLSRVRTLEETSVELLIAVHRTAELRTPLVNLQTEMERSRPVVERVWAHWAAGEPRPDTPLQS
jgi:hypothetical protein